MKVTIEELLKSQAYLRLTVGYRWLYHENGVWVVMEQKYRKHTHSICYTTSLEDALDVLLEEEMQDED